jgi:hypothetical protein
MVDQPLLIREYLTADAVRIRFVNGLTGWT